MKDNWFHTNKTFNHKDAIELSTFTAYRSTFRFDNFLKRLHFTGDYSDYDQLNLNALTQLEQLKIDLKVPDSYASKTVFINLPNLKVLEVGSQYDEDDPSQFYLRTPKLEILKCYQLDPIHLSDPNNINHLDLILFTDIVHSLKNVQYLKADWGFLPNPNILSFFPKLTTLYCNQDYFDEEDQVESMNTLRHLVKQKLNRKRPELKIYFQSVELLDTNKIDEYDSQESILSFQINNYNLLCENVSYLFEVDYNELMRLVDGKLPDKAIFKKYFNIPTVKVSGDVKNQEHLVQFLTSLDYLKELFLENTFLDQTFYNRLHNFGQLTELTMTNISVSFINYNFLLKLKLLQKFTTNRDFDFFDLTFQLYNVLKYLKRISFYFDREFIAIDAQYENRNQCKWYTFTRYKNTVLIRRDTLISLKERMDFDHLVSEINAYKSDRLNLRN